jgi:hypothetical protein
VFITNLSDSLMFLGQHNYVNYMVREAKNEAGQWVPIELFDSRFPCNSCRLLYLKPKQVLIAKVMRTTGSFKTTCRLKLSNASGAVYSNEFTDYIDKRALAPIDASKPYLKLN